MAEILPPPAQLTSFDRPVTALVNGASRGIGLALVKELAECAAVGRVYATCRTPASAEPLNTLAENSDGCVVVVAMDVEDESTVERAAARIEADAASIDLLINTFGLLHEGREIRPEKRIRDIDPARLARSFSVNAIGHAVVAKHFVDRISTGRRTILAQLSARVGSIADNRLGGWYGYRASKAAQNMITRTLAIELSRLRPDCVCLALHPGTTETDLSAPFTRRTDPDKLFSPQRAARQLLHVIDGARVSGSFLAWDGSEVQW
jgi:NAD(P)-dependent dehydrogenase (short-subunit alcohol dehydrogenase family)